MAEDIQEKGVDHMNKKEWKEMKKKYYKKDFVALTDDGTIDFSVEGYRSLKKNGHEITYDQYLDIMRASGGRERTGFSYLFYNGGYGDFKGQIQYFTKNRKKVIFRKICINTMTPDGKCFDGKEDHVWMDACDFDQFSPGDNVSFGAEIYRYLKHDGKQIGFGLRNPCDIEKIEPYALPTDDDMMRQAIADIVCEVCPLSEQCYGVFCMREDWRDAMKEMLFAMNEAGMKK